MKTIAFDIETSGLLEDNPVLNCICLSDVDGDGSVLSFHDTSLHPKDGSLEEGLEILKNAENLYAHNGISFDYPALKQICGVDLEGFKHDTFVAAQVFFPNLFSAKEEEYEGSNHSIEDWGKRFGIPKVHITDFEFLTNQILDRCIVDVQIMVKLIHKIRAKAKTHPGLLKAYKFELEAQKLYYENCSKVKLDMAAVDSLLDEYSTLLDEYSQKVYHMIPMRVANTDATTTVAKRAPKTKYQAVLTIIDDGTYTTVVEDIDDPDELKDRPNLFKVELYECGSLRKTVLDWALKEGVDPETIVGDFTKLKYPNMASSKQLKDWLLGEGWKPNSFTNKGEPSLRDSDFIGVPDSVAEAVTSMNIIKHRYGLVKGLKARAKGEYIRPWCEIAATNTRRVKHRLLANFPRPSSAFAERLRSVVVPFDGHVLVGCDASGLEARVFAHYTHPFDGGYIANILLEGDIHSANAELFGVSRQLAKSGLYCLLYGGSAKRLAQVLGKDESEADTLYNTFWEAYPALTQLRDFATSSVQKRSADKKKNRWSPVRGEDYILGIDGTPIFVRTKHSIINTLFQSAGAIIMKRAFIEICKKLPSIDPTAKCIVFYHDEVQVSCKEEVAETVGEMMREEIINAGKYYKLNVPLDGEYKIGRNWVETH